MRTRVLATPRCPRARQLRCGAAELLATAEFEEKQNNPTHARERHADILRKRPKPRAAKAAEARLKALEGR